MFIHFDCIIVPKNEEKQFLWQDNGAFFANADYVFRRGCGHGREGVDGDGARSRVGR